MAVALVGGSFLSAFLQVLFDRLASPEVVDFFKGRKLDDQLLKKLKIILNSVDGVLDDAEEKQINKPAVKNWLNNLKDAAYEADDLLDEIAYGVLQSKLEAGQLKKKVWNFFSSRNPFRKTLATELEQTLASLEYLVNQKDALGLRESIGQNPSSSRVPTTSLVDEFGVYGRDDDKEAIMKFLLLENENSNNPDVITIVGMAGVGKTTLAQLLYNDERVAEHFRLKGWVCVSEEFDVTRVTKDILEEVSRSKSDIHNLNQLQLEVKEIVMNQKFLLILDDVWNDQYAHWDILLAPLKFGAKGSKIVVTTRNERVALVMRSGLTHHLKELGEYHCWSLFEKHAFDGGHLDAHEDLEAIGREIVRKCKGLPLAAKTMGCLLRSKTDAEEWKKILNSKLWYLRNDNILPALGLSYHYLPSHLKRCFAYCAMFPKDYNFKRQELVFLWMAEGFLPQPDGNKELEEVGGECFNDLVSRSFFQHSSGTQPGFTMHDLIHDLAMFVSGEFSFRFDGNDMSNISRTVRHLSYTSTKRDASKKFQAIYEAKFLRTLFPLEFSQSRQHTYIDTEVFQNLLPALRCLRVLSLSHYHNIVNLPNSVGNLKHLRYLDLSSTSIEKLPEVVSALYYLQTLILHECKDLAVVPDSIGNMIHLRYLDLFQTSIKILPESMGSLCNLRTLILQGCRNLFQMPTSMGRLIHLCHLDISDTKLQEMPLEMGKLVKLQKLTHFIVGKQRGSSIKELGGLQDLHGEIYIRNLQNVANVGEASEANLKAKRLLKRLTFKWNGETENLEHDRELLEQLQPHTNLEDLYIIGYGGIDFPSWIGACSSNIVHLELNGCKNCTSLPPLGQLTSLKELSIIDFNRVVVVGGEFYGSCSSLTNTKKSFGCLRILKFERMLHWHEWLSCEHGAFPLLQELYIRECPNLTRMISDHLPSLTLTKIVGCQQLDVTSFPRAPAITGMRLYDDSRDLLLEQLSSGQLRLIVCTNQQLDPLNFILEVTSLNEIEIKIGWMMKAGSIRLKKLSSGLYRFKVYGFKSLESLNLLMKKMDELAIPLNEIEVEDCSELKLPQSNSLCLGLHSGISSPK
ncbi:putative disease resistance RPP13-like protein 1 [Mercurialis annua]|uniref:putative disease resistance RPP13-like protein 1 n=1 Tax=Mercurialis annua TaxID=3986 RepID=UPI00215FA7EA|nr:putative disease resistance RPP13-like protein 1 [Mercurialis annua]